MIVVTKVNEAIISINYVKLCTQFRANDNDNTTISMLTKTSKNKKVESTIDR